jgi:hypothetical protein
MAIVKMGLSKKEEKAAHKIRRVFEKRLFVFYKVSKYIPVLSFNISSSNLIITRNKISCSNFLWEAFRSFEELWLKHGM